MRPRFIFIVFAVLVIAAVPARGQEAWSVPLDNAAYEDLSYFRALGFWKGGLELLPLTRADFARAVDAIEEQDRITPLSTADRARLRRLEQAARGAGPGSPAGAAAHHADPAGSQLARESTSGNAPVRLEGAGALALYGAATGLDSLADLDRRNRREGAFFLSLNGAMGKRFLFETRFYEDYSRFTPQPGTGHWVDNFPIDARGVLTDPSARNDRAILGATWGWGDLRLGREDRRWGPGRRGTLFLSENPFPLDGVTLRVHTRYLSAASLFAQNLRARTPHGTPADSSIGTDSYFAGHRIQIDALGPVHVGLYEAVVWGDRGIDLGYINPVGFLVAMTQDIVDRSGADDKKVIGGDVRLDAAPFTLYGEFLLNRLVTLDVSQGGDNAQISSFAELAGMEWARPLGWNGADFTAEYAHIDPEVYFHKDRSPERAFLTEGEVIGHWAGPNADALHLACALPPSVRWGGMRVEFEQVRWGLLNGLRGIDAGFVALRKKDKRWITGPVQRERTASVSWAPPDWKTPFPGRLGGTLTLARISRSGAWPVSAGPRSGWQAEVRLRWEVSGTREDSGE